MRTWSLESAFVKAYSVAALTVQTLIDAAHTVERVSRPVRRGERDGAEEFPELRAEVCRAHRSEMCLVCDENNDDLWVHPRDFDGAEQLAEREAEIDAHEPHEESVWEAAGRAIKASPRFCGPCGTCGTVHGDEHIGLVDNVIGAEIHDDTPNPTEPGLSDDELIGVRGLLQERLRHTVDAQSPPACSCGLEMRWSTALSEWIHTIDFSPVCDQASPAVSADARVSAAESGSPPPSPSVACIDPSSTRRSGYGPSLGGEGAAADSGIPQSPAAARPLWSDLADAIVEHRPSAKAEEPDVIAVIEVLAEHSYRWADQWRDHVADLIAEALEPHRIYTKLGPLGEAVPVELRPEMGNTYGEWRFTADELALLGLKPGDHLGRGVIGPPINSAASVFRPTQ